MHPAGCVETGRFIRTQSCGQQLTAVPANGCLAKVRFGPAKDRRQLVNSIYDSGAPGTHSTKCKENSGSP